MNRTEQSNRKNERAGRRVGLLFTVAAHAALFFVFLNVALEPEYSLPDNSIILLDFTEPQVQPEPPKPIEVKAGNAATKSLDSFVKEFEPSVAIKLVDGNVGRVEKKLTLPHYFAMFL